MYKILFETKRGLEACKAINERGESVPNIFKYYEEARREVDRQVKCGFSRDLFTIVQVF